MDLEHILPEFRHVAGWDTERRIRFLEEPRWIGYRRAESIIEELKRWLSLPKRPRMPNLLIVGEPNNGKTTLVRTFQEEHGQGYVNEEDEPVKPVVIAEAPPVADEKGLYISILERFAAPYRETSAASALRMKAIRMLRYCNTNMLIIDEFHSLLTGTSRQQRVVMNALKTLCNELAIPIVGVGTREAVKVLHTDSQYSSRFEVRDLPAWKADTEFQALVASFETVLPLRKPSLMHEPALVTPIYSICGGNIGNLHRLLRACAGEAIRSGTEQITKKIVEEHSWQRPGARGIWEKPP